MCDWYVDCNNTPTGTVKHPILGHVPTCERCADKHDLLLLGLDQKESTRMSGELTPYMVTFRVVDDATERKAPCVLMDGDTTVEDFPRLIATRIWGDPTRQNDVTVVAYHQTV